MAQVLSPHGVEVKEQGRRQGTEKILCVYPMRCYSSWVVPRNPSSFCYVGTMLHNNNVIVIEKNVNNSIDNITDVFVLYCN